MKALSSDLVALLASGVPLYRADLYQIGPMLNGAMIYATNAQLPISYGGNTYQPTTFGLWSRGDIEVKIGLESNSCKLTVFADNQYPIYFPGSSNMALLLDGIKYGLLGAAPVTISTAYMQTWGKLYGRTDGSLVETKFVGMCANVDSIGMTRATISVQDMMYLLNIQVPRNVIQPSCANVLYDQVCTLPRTSFSRTGQVNSVSNTLQFRTTANLSPHTASGTFTQGWLTWTSGHNSGLTCFVRQWTPASGYDTIQLDVQTIFPLAANDQFTIYQGCSKTFSSCSDLQGGNAYLNYRGCPNVPVPEVAIG